jgi:hypothetical protein
MMIFVSGDNDFVDLVELVCYVSGGGEIHDESIAI